MKKNTIEIQKEKKGEPRKGILTLENEINFSNTRDLLDNFVQNIDNFDTLVIQGSVDSMDLTGLQAMLSIRKSLKEKNKTIALGIKMNEDAKSLIIRSGFKEIFETF